MYANAPATRDEIIKLAQDHYRTSLLGKDGRIYDKAVVMCVMQLPRTKSFADWSLVAISIRVAIVATLTSTARWNTMRDLSSRRSIFTVISHSIE